jgi:dephospho-CoA kinase
MILGIAGTLGAGKGTIVEYLVKHKGFSHYSSSTILKQMVSERKLPPTRKNLSELADELMRQHQGGILYFSHLQAKKDGASNYVLEALHRVSEAQYFKSIGGTLLGIDADIKLRFDRISQRKEGVKDEVTFEQFTKDSQREDEGKTGSGPNIREVMKMADYTIYNDTDTASLYHEIDEVLRQIEDAT